MRRSIQPEPAGTTLFFTLALQDRSARWLVDHVAGLRQAFRLTRLRHPFELQAIVVLPEHLHAIWTLPVGDTDAAARCALLRQSFTDSLRAAGMLEAAAPAWRSRSPGRQVWARGGWEHRIRDDQELQRHVDYIHFNPVKHGWVLRPADWPYSSLHRFVRAGRLPPDWSLSAAVDGQFGE